MPNFFDNTKLYKNTPLIVIVGRPNVGKSTLFNRLLSKRRSITDPTPGVTRDPVEEQTFIKEKPVRLLDTGGFKLTRGKNENENFLDDLVVKKTLESLKNADRILLLLDATLATPEDEEFIKFLRPFWDKLVVAVNKTEGGRLEAEAYNYMRFGFKSLLCISAEHGDRISELSDMLISGLDFSKVVESNKEEDTIRIAIVGKPNTGKSTLSNFLTQTKKSIVSDIPGTTRDVVEGKFSYKGKNFKIVDTAGIRKKSKVNENIEYYSVVRAIKSLDSADIVFHLIDAQEGLTDQDKKICVQAANRGLGIIFVLNKWDTMPDEKGAFKKAERDIKVMFGKMEYAPICAISAIQSTGIKNLLNISLQMFKQLTKKIETSALNMALRDWFSAYPPPAPRFTLKYMVQTGTRPLQFLIFCNKPENVKEGYKRYLKNRIRQDLGFSMVPVNIDIKASRKKWEER